MRYTKKWLKANVETFEPVLGYEFLYSITPDGMVYSERQKRFLIQQLTPSGVYCVCLTDYVSRESLKAVKDLVWISFFGEFNRDYQRVHMINEDHSIWNLQLIGKDDGVEYQTKWDKRNPKSKTCEFGHKKEHPNLIVDKGKPRRRCRACHLGRAQMFWEGQQGLNPWRAKPEWQDKLKGIADGYYKEIMSDRL